MSRIFAFIKLYSLSTLCFLYLHSIGWLKEKHRILMHHILIHFRLESPKEPERPCLPPLHVPSVQEENLFDSTIEIAVPHLIAGQGNVSAAEISIINKLLRKYKPSACFEIGTFDGRTTLNMAYNTPDNTCIYTLDLPAENLNKTVLDIDFGDTNYIDKPVSGSRFLNDPYALEKITQLYGDSASFDFSPWRGKIDFVFVDGSHSYDYVRNDTKVALHLLRNGEGTIVWHDYGSQYFRRLTVALNELHAEIPQLKTMKHIQGTSLCFVHL